MPRNFAEVFDGRLAALSSADRLISSQGTGLARLLERELAAAGGDASRYCLEGPEIVLHPGCTFALSMLFHELASNAERHGSLSVRGGRVDVTWRLDDGDLLLTWTESGGPPARRPSSPGFGNLLVAFAAVKLNGTADCLYRQSGLICDLRVSLSASWPRRRGAMRLGIPDTVPARPN